MYLIVGFGKLAQSVLQLSSYEDEIYVYSKSKEKIDNYNDRRLSYVTKEEFSKVRHVLLMLPASEINGFIREYEPYFCKNTVFYCFATALNIKDIQTSRNVIPCKLAGHAKQMIDDQHGLFVVPKDVDVTELVKVLGPSFTIITGTEQEVLLANTLGTKAAIEMIIGLEEKLINAGVQKAVIDQTLLQVTRGNIKAYLHQDLGGFAVRIVDEIRKGRIKE